MHTITPRPYKGGEAPRFANLKWGESKYPNVVRAARLYIGDTLDIVVVQLTDGSYTVYDYGACPVNGRVANTRLDALDVECFLITAYPER
jgi:hypothetical protein